MGAKSRRKGARAELDVVRYLQAQGLTTADRVRPGVSTPGDVAGLAHVLEVKDHQRITLAPWVDQLRDEVAGSLSLGGVVVVKRRGCTDPGDWYAVQPLEWYVEDVLKTV